MNKYEISVWEDYFVPASGSTESHYEERKLCVIGSNTMTDGSRALEPNLVLNVNGTHTLTFKLYLSYIDTITGERIDNPFVKLLVNERKVKAYWDNGQEDINDKWYDLVVKDISEDSDSNTVTYTCEDLFINELGKSGFELNFSDEANNNQGTIYELATAVLDGTDWQLDEENTDHLLQTQEEALYEVKITNMNALTGIYANGFLNITKDTYEKIPNNATCYLPYSMVPHSDDELADMTAVQFIYAPEYTTEYSSMLITNEDSNWLVTGGVWVKSGDIYQFKIPSSGTTKTIFTINLSNAFVSDKYRGNVYCRKQLSTYDANLERYVNVYKVKDSTPSADDKRIFGYVDYDYDASDLVNNLLANNKDFKNTNGWIGKNLKIGLFPELGLDTDLTKYEGHSYLSAAINAGQDLVNNTLSSAAQYLSSGLFEGMEVKFQIGLKDEFKDGTLSVAVVNKKDNSTICLGSLETNEEDSSNPTPIFTPLKASTDSNGTVWYSGTLTCLKALAKNFLEDAELVIKSTNPKDAIIEIIETRLYELIHGKDKDGNDIILDLYDINSTDVAKKFYYYYLEDTSNPDGTAPYIYKAQVPCPLYEPVYGGWAKSAGATEREYSQFEKVRTIYGQQSNRFNLLQELAETFKCWARFKIYHNADGSIERDSNGKQKKTVYFSEKIGQQLSYGFTYGIDLNTIRRTQSSSELVTKTIVLANYNDNAPNGTCSIVDSEENYPRENFVLNFDYYVNHGLLDGEALNRDLYYSGAGNDYIGYYTKLHKYNIEYLSAADRAILLRNQEVRLLQQSVVYDGLLACAVKERDELIDELAALGGDTLDPTKTDPKANNSDKSSEIITAKWISIQKALQQMKQIISYKTDKNNNVISNSKVEGPSDQNADLIKTIKDLDGDIASYKVICAKLDAALAALKLTIEANTANRDRLLKLIKELHQKFYNKYSNYIQEGSWTSEDYIDPNIYYYDALSVAYTSSRPQVQYDIAVTRVSELPEFKFRRFHVGDTTYVQDTDFFGYEPYLKNDKVRTPYKEAVLISEISINFEEPDKDTITVQNYKTQFEDLFQRINATTQSLQYAQGGYNRAAGVVNGKGELKEDILQDSLLAAQDIVTKATDESVVQDNTGITLTSLKNLDQKLKITSGGIVFSDDGGETWTTMMKAGQIGVQFLSAGSISTSKITIMDGTTPAFRWDTNGITAYWSGKDYLTPESNPVLKMNRFVRFDKFGIYGYNNNNDNDNTNFVPANEEEIRSNPNSMFSLTWSGLLIRSVEKNGDTEVGSIEINNKYDIVVKKGNKNKIQIGRLNDNGNYGIRICDNEGNPVLETVDNGSLWLRQSLSIGTEASTNVKIGVLNNNQIFNANDNFIVKKDGTAEMTGELRIKGKYKDLLLKSFRKTQQYDDFCGIFLVPTTDSTGSQYKGIIGFSFDSKGTAGGVVQSPGVLSISGTQSLELSGSVTNIIAGKTMVLSIGPAAPITGYNFSFTNPTGGIAFGGEKAHFYLKKGLLEAYTGSTRLSIENGQIKVTNLVYNDTREYTSERYVTYEKPVNNDDIPLKHIGYYFVKPTFSTQDSFGIRMSQHPKNNDRVMLTFWTGTDCQTYAGSITIGSTGCWINGTKVQGA